MVRLHALYAALPDHKKRITGCLTWYAETPQPPPPFPHCRSNADNVLHSKEPLSGTPHSSHKSDKRNHCFSHLPWPPSCFRSG